MTSITDWISAVGQVAGSLFAAVAAVIALFTARTAKLQTEESISATKRQAAAAAVQELIGDYAAVEMYKALQRFGRFVGDESSNKERFGNITDSYLRLKGKLDIATVNDPDFSWAIAQIENDKELTAARRQIHHYFKRIWALRKAKVIEDDVDLYIVTKANYGYALWQREVVPLTVALGILQHNRGRPSAADDKWHQELIYWVEAASAKLDADSHQV